MPVYKTEAIILRHQALGEADRIVTAFTREYGKLRLVARGIRRTTSRLGGRIEPFTHVRLLLARGRSMDVVAQAEVVQTFSGLREDLLRSAYGSYIAELVERFLPERDKHETVFDLVRHTLEALEAVREDDVEVEALWFALRLASDLGYRPETESCVECARPLPRDVGRPATSWMFSPSLGGALCPGCSAHDPDALAAAPGVLAICAYLLRFGAGMPSRLKIPPVQRADLARLVQHHLEYRLEGRLRVPQVIHRLRQPGPPT